MKIVDIRAVKVSITCLVDEVYSIEDPRAGVEQVQD